MKRPFRSGGSLKFRLAALFAGSSMLLLVGTLAYIYLSHSASRKEEFNMRLRAQCIRVATLLNEVRDADRQLLRVIDINTIHRIHDEKVLLFNAADDLIYSSLDDEPIPYSGPLLERIRTEGQIAYTDPDGDEVVGVHYTEDGADLVVLASAFDTFGKREIDNLVGTLSISLVLGALFIFAAAYFYIGFALRPVARLQQAISAIDVDRLDQHLRTVGNRDEIDQLAVSYNAMLDRLRAAFDLQRAFVNNASHELRTPLAHMNATVERALGLPPESSELRSVLRTLQNDIVAQGTLVESLLLLQRLQANIPVQRTPVRVDEVLFASLDELRTLHPEAHAEVDFAQGIKNAAQLTVPINELLLRTAIRNLLVNAVIYGTDKRVHLALAPEATGLRITISNKGNSALPERIFEPFFRASDNASVPGSGLGLSIVKQVVERSGGSVSYRFDGEHRFDLVLPTGR